MIELLADHVIERIIHVSELYYRLIILISPAGSGKTAILHSIQERQGYPLIKEVDLVGDCCPSHVYGAGIRYER